MRNKMLSTYRNMPKKLYYSPTKWHESQVDGLVDALIKSNRELIQLYAKAPEDDFSSGKTSEEISDYWEDED